VMQFGFDVEVSLKIGCNLYSVVTVYARAAIEIPFRINVPEFRDAICDGAADSCASEFQVSTTIAINLSFYLGVELDFSTFEQIVETAVNGAADASGQDIDLGGIEVLLGTFEIMPETGLSCASLTDSFSFLGEAAVTALDGLVRDKCCEDSDEDTIVTTTPLLAQSSPAMYMIVDGAPGNHNDNKPEECTLATSTNGIASNHKGDKIGVQCCNAAGTRAYRKTIGCLEEVTFYEAEQACAQAGHRLCTQAEVASSLGGGTGCGFDKYHVWTSTPCTGAVSARVDGGAFDDEWLDEDEQLDDEEWRPVDGDGVADISKDAVVVEVPMRAMLFVFALMVLLTVVCVGWRFGGCCRGKTPYAKVQMVSETEAEEDVAINYGDEQL